MKLKLTRRALRRIFTPVFTPARPGIRVFLSIGKSFAMPRRRDCRLGFTLLDAVGATLCCGAIGVFAILFLDGCGSAREAGRLNTCRDRLNTLAKGLTQYEASAGHFPGYMNALTRVDGTPYIDFTTGNVTPVSWVVEIMPQVDRGVVYDLWKQAPDLSSNSGGYILTTRLYIELFTCPSAEANQAGAPLSFFANAGMTDLRESIPSTDDKPGVPRDWPANGVFFDHFTDSLKITGKSRSRGPEVKMSRAMIRDPAATTILLVENADTSDYVLESGADPSFRNCETDWGCTWDPGRIRTDGGKFDMRPPPDADDRKSRRPSSHHVGGYNGAFVDGSVRFLSDKINYGIYCKLMASDDANAKMPGSDELLDIAFRNYKVVDQDLAP